MKVCNTGRVRGAKNTFTQITDTTVLTCLVKIWYYYSKMSIKSITEEQKEHIRQGVLKYYGTEAGKARRDAMIGKPAWNKGTGRPKPQSRIIKAVLQYSKTGVFIRQWPSVTVASGELGICLQGIWYCAEGMRKSAGGYVWRYEKT